MERDEHDHDYFLRREAHERRLAARALDPSIARIHQDMADRYAERARDATRPSARRLRIVA